MGSIIFAILTFLFYLIPNSALGAPHPVSGNAVLSDSRSSMYLLRLGFQLSFENTPFELQQSENSTFRYLSEKFPEAIISVRHEELNTALPLESYAKRWIKDYSSFGMDVVGTQSFVENKNQGFLVDLQHKATQKKIRQAIFLKDKTSVILSCSDKLESFKDTLKLCNEIIRSFNWTQKGL